MKTLYRLLQVSMLACTLNAQAELSVVTTTEDLSSIAQSIGGDRISVSSLTRGSADPHFSAAKPSMIRQVFHADLLLVVGADMEAGWLPALLRSARNARVLPENTGYLDLSRHVELMGILSGTVDRSMGDVHASGNPHYWLDPENGLKIAMAIREKLVSLDDSGKAVYIKNYAAFKQRLENEKQRWMRELSFIKGKSVIAYHTSFIYLADAFGFNIVNEVEPKPGISPSAAALNELVKHIQKDKIGLLIMEPWYEMRSSQWLQDQTGIRVAVIPQSVNEQAGIHSYFDLFDKIVNSLKEAQE